MKITYVSKLGKQHNNSQDCVLINDTVINNFAGTVDTTLNKIAVADGVGGVPGGYEASSFVLRKISEQKNISSAAELKNSLISINHELIEYASKLDDKKAMATTMTGLAVIDHSLYMIHAGNTRLYAYINGKVKQLSKDHTNFQALLEDSLVDEKGLEDYQDKNVIYCCFGTGNAEYLNSLVVEEIKLDKVPEFFMLTSDGIHDHINENELNQLIKENLDDRNKILAMLEKADENGSTDDCTAVIARV